MNDYICFSFVYIIRPYPNPDAGLDNLCKWKWDPGNGREDPVENRQHFWDVGYIIVTSQWARWRLKSLESQLLAQLFVLVQINTSKLRITNICERNHLWAVDSPHKGSATRNMFPFDDVIMKNGIASKKWYIMQFQSYKHVDWVWHFCPWEC